MSHLEIRALSCIRGERRLFDDLDASLRQGEVLHVRGANGSGKSSLLRILATLAAPERGMVLWGGVDVNALGHEYSAALRYVGHHNGLKLDLTAAENLAFHAALGGASAAGDMIGVLEKSGLGPVANLPARRLSAGQRRRLALARLQLWPCALWLLDEPLTSLDREGRALFGQWLAAHSHAGGITVMATHEGEPGVGGPHRDLVLQ